MTSSATLPQTPATYLRGGYLRTEDCHMQDLLDLLAEPTDAAAYPHSSRIEQQVIMYDAAHLRAALAAGEGEAIEAELVHAWLGPGYQVTAQANVVRPGGKAQTVHRDYHLGFMDSAQAAAHPAQVHLLSPHLTLQGAVAHVDMPVESGPTLYLPHSQKYSHGYLAYWLPEFQDYFVANHIQLPLAKGDLVWFNPALMHAAGTNVSADIQRVATLLQVSRG